jgi:hypothetical protein
VSGPCPSSTPLMFKPPAEMTGGATAVTLLLGSWWYEPCATPTEPCILTCMVRMGDGEQLAHRLSCQLVGNTLFSAQRAYISLVTCRQQAHPGRPTTGCIELAQGWWHVPGRQHGWPVRHLHSQLLRAAFRAERLPSSSGDSFLLWLGKGAWLSVSGSCHVYHTCKYSASPVPRLQMAGTMSAAAILSLS